MIIPAIDLIDGQVVRLYQGDYQQQTHYALSPVDVVHRYADAGATWLHIVDLSGAKDPEKRQLKLISEMVATGRMQFQAGGGIRSEEDLAQLLEAGVSRVVIGSLAVKQPELVKSWLKQYGAEKIVLALDVNIDEHGRKCIATHGWQQNSGVELGPLLDQMIAAGAKHVLCTDIACDGTLQGPNTSLYQQMKREFPEIVCQASGGIGNLEHIHALKPSGVDSVILGRSLLEGKFELAEAIQLWEKK
ncbi:1-(5-phosphoribosyl)-5-[(5-phosphoribosylamino)methylideneamino]imidazole-4-carboxamide isomerase [Lacimicrobium alkaliphilum]|uniref:1-(5-phosphoribosyl)-5-[(5-phosphoribosylamino)methylideneamino] imidazole-4-carboxamide isomerase n=1 Tax=Lacimicrobium alkaliphilum TaxID=1526571 RepID=A0ABQ1RIP9_9ALTE|nr:1-(5-phosphoribosyl)-5-[(5-phosphoribosylamino)methylideneamino]imidazole-4-carboxamide isomerase [Lacimicrobium alkaliphilum]GGD67703.1 1-(5-phosphoribosyl)-5-[(5-phosphoribosylamino) methylideneamino] imidazole-4-carboxamide isomerase [Lacimicrobium alkaliphilum]